MDVPAALARLRSAADDGGLDRLAAAHGVRLLTVFGSAATDAASARDLDVAVSLGPGADPVELVNALLDLVGSDALDVMILDGASPVARRNALCGPVIPLFESEPGLYARSEMAAALDFFDTAWMRDAAVALMAEG